MLRRIFSALRAKPSDPQRGSRMLFVGPNSTGLYVDEEVAFSVSTVWACLDVISSSLAASDWNVYEGLRGADDSTLRPADALQYVLNTRPNPEMTAKRFKQAMMLAAAGWGNGYAEIVRDLAGRVVEIWPIEPDRCELRRDRDTGQPFLRVMNAFDSTTVDLGMQDVLHFGGPGLSGLLGDKPVAKAVRAIALAVAQERYAEVYFGNNTQMGGWLEVPTTLGDVAFERLKTQLEAGHKGVKKAFKFAVFEGGAKWHAAEADAGKSQVTEARYQQVEEICRWFKVPPHKVGHLLRATNNNIEHQGLEFVRDTLRPWKVEIEQECDYKLFSPRGPKRFIDVDLDWASEGDLQSRMTAYSTARAMGVYSVNDVLRKLRENTIGPEGDIRTMNGASVRLEDVGKQAVAPAANGDTGGNPNDTARAWLASTYARVWRRYGNRLNDGQEASAARASARAYALEQLGEMGDVLGGRRALALAGADLVLEGHDAAAAAAEVFA